MELMKTLGTATRTDEPQLVDCPLSGSGRRESAYKRIDRSSEERQGFSSGSVSECG